MGSQDPGRDLEDDRERDEDLGERGESDDLFDKLEAPACHIPERPNPDICRGCWKNRQREREKEIESLCGHLVTIMPTSRASNKQ